jgi:hypothetical protein
MNEATPLLSAALAYAQRGWRVIPLHTPLPNGACSCRGRSKNCKPGKHPQTRNGVRDASADERQIRKWWSQWPTANIGIVTDAASGIVAVDVDDRSGGTASLAALVATHGPIPLTPVSRTGNGRHLIFRHPGGRVANSAGAVARGIDVRGDGGYIVAPPSLHVTGAQYEWEHAADICPVAPLPDWFFPRACYGVERVAGVAGIDRKTENPEVMVGVGGLIDRTIPTAVGTRNASLMAFARGLKSIPEYADADPSALRALVTQWHAKALPHIQTKAFDETWSEFIVIWPNTRGEAVAVALAAADNGDDPPEVARLNYQTPALIRLLRWCRELQRRAGGEPFFLICATAARHLDVTTMTASRYMKTLTADGLIDVVEWEKPGRGRRYRYLNQDARSAAASPNGPAVPPDASAAAGTPTAGVMATAAETGTGGVGKV